jgi:hypothetical protein
MSPNLGRHCVSLRHRRVPDTPNLYQLQPTIANQPKRTGILATIEFLCLSSNNNHEITDMLGIPRHVVKCHVVLDTLTTRHFPVSATWPATCRDMSLTRHRMSPFGQQKRHADIRHNGLSPRSNLHCMRANIGNTASISRMSVLEVPLCFIRIGYHWESSDLSREAEKRSNCEIGSNIMHEWGGHCRGGGIIHCSNQQMTQQTGTNWWGMIVVEWFRDDGMARILMTGVVPPHWVRAYFLAVC